MCHLRNFEPRDIPALSWECVFGLCKFRSAAVLAADMSLSFILLAASEFHPGAILVGEEMHFFPKFRTQELRPPAL